MFARIKLWVKSPKHQNAVSQVLLLWTLGFHTRFHQLQIFGHGKKGSQVERLRLKLRPTKKRTLAMSTKK